MGRLYHLIADFVNSTYSLTDFNGKYKVKIKNLS